MLKWDEVPAPELYTSSLVPKAKCILPRDICYYCWAEPCLNCCFTQQLVSVIKYTVGIKLFDPLLIFYVYPLTKNLSVYNFKGSLFEQWETE